MYTKGYNSTQEAPYLHCIMLVIVPCWSGCNWMKVWCMSDQKCHTLSGGFIATHLISTRDRLSVCQSFILCMPLCVMCVSVTASGDTVDIPVLTAWNFVTIDCRETVIICLHCREETCHFVAVTCSLRDSNTNETHISVQLLRGCKHRGCVRTRTHI